MQKQAIIKIYVISILTTVLMFCVFFFLNNYFDGNVWNNMQTSKSAIIVEYCELNQTDKFFHQTINTYSNLAYFFFGMIVILAAYFDKKNRSKLTKNHIQQFPLISFLFGSCLIYLCFGSAFFHASLTWIGQRVDMNGTYGISIVLLGISSHRYFVKKETTAAFKKIFTLVLIVIILVFVELHLLISSLILLPLLIITICTFTVLNYLQNNNNFNMQFAMLSLALMIAAIVLRTLDIKKIGCNPISVYQGHAIWHLFTGMSAFMLYWFYRSEENY